jgi:hypothetical protein
MANGKEEKKCKRMKKNVIKNEITLEDYKVCLFSGKSMHRKMNVKMEFRLLQSGMVAQSKMTKWISKKNW